MRTRPWTPFIRGVQAVALAAGVFFAVACSGAEPSAATATAPLPATRLTEATPASAAAENAPVVTSSDTVFATGVTLPANDASISELAAAFESAGISNARRWAREVDEYRPYSVDDTGYTKLRGELAKYNPASGVVDAIVARLHLP